MNSREPRLYISAKEEEFPSTPFRRTKSTAFCLTDPTTRLLLIHREIRHDSQPLQEILQSSTCWTLFSAHSEDLTCLRISLFVLICAPFVPCFFCLVFIIHLLLLILFRVQRGNPDEFRKYLILKWNFFILLIYFSFLLLYFFSSLPNRTLPTHPFFLDEGDSVGKKTRERFEAKAKDRSKEHLSEPRVRSSVHRWFETRRWRGCRSSEQQWGRSWLSSSINLNLRRGMNVILAAAEITHSGSRDCDILRVPHCPAGRQPSPLILEIYCFKRSCD